jgi:Cu2+-exporting ATPase
VLADRVARRYAPAVHGTALATFLGWYFVGGATASQALVIACAVLIITCPCALALAVPVVQVIATGGLFRSGILLKSATALERLAEIDTVVFDKTGTLTEPNLVLVREGVDPVTLRDAASLAAHSRHPLARAVVAANGGAAAVEDVEEHPGLGLSGAGMRLGSAAFAGVSFSTCPGTVRPAHSSEQADAAKPRIRGLNGRQSGPELWFRAAGREPVRFTFEEKPRIDAAETIARLRRMGLRVRLLSGDRVISVARVATAVGIDDWRAECSPVEKVTLLRRMGGRVLMVGDGLNDGPCLAEAHVSASPATAADISQTLADAVFQGAGLAAVADLIQTARQGRRIMRGNIALSIVYNLAMVPLAVVGLVTPWLAAAAMSGSSLLVIGNSFRVRA